MRRTGAMWWLATSALVVGSLVWPTSASPAPTPAAAVAGPCGPYPCLDSFSELAAWDATTTDPRQIATVPLATRAVTSNPGMVVGLDFTGWNYAPLGDGATQGGPVGNLYPFNHWQYVDTAYYYRHGLIVIPPVVWTNAAHRNGARMLGTVTADFDYVNGDCSPGGDQFNEMFSTTANASTTLRQLESLASTFGFDGWLLDFECGAEINDQVTDTLTALRADGFAALVYEAGSRSLDQGTDIFDAANAAGGWQGDYPVEDGDPEDTYNTITAAPPPHLDRWSAFSAASVYQNEDFAAPPCAQDHLANGKRCLNFPQFMDELGSVTEGSPPEGAWTSFGVYAPAWPAYAGSSTFGDQLPPIALWRGVDDTIWDGRTPTGPACSTQASGAISRFVTARSVIGSLPFVTRFNRGIGGQYTVEGTIGSSTEWNHFGAQDVLPMWFCRLAGADDEVTLGYTDTASWDGGSSLTLASSGPVDQQNEWQLWSAAAVVQAPVVRLRYRGSGAIPFIRLRFQDGSSAVAAPTAAPLAGWQTFEAPVVAAGKTLVAVSLGTRPATPGTRATVPVDLQVGEIAIVEAGQLVPPALIIPTFDGASTSVLTWAAPASDKANVWAVDDVAQCLEFLGPAFTNSYDLATALFPASVDSTQGGYRVQPVSSAGVAAPLDLRPCNAPPIAAVPPPSSPLPPVTTPAATTAAAAAPVAVGPRFTG